MRPTETAAAETTRRLEDAANDLQAATFKLRAILDTCADKLTVKGQRKVQSAIDRASDAQFHCYTATENLRVRR